MKNLKMYFILFFLLIIYVGISATSYAFNITSNISNEIFRLHVIANSDSQEDQDLKYIVRNNILNHINKFSFNNKEELVSFIDSNITEIENIAKETIINNGFDYEVSSEIGHFNFPTKNYGDISLPAGNYDSLRIKLGSSKGQNWWCVMFPPLCFVDITSGIVDESSKRLLEDHLEEEEYALVSENTTDMKFKFKLLEFFNTFNTILANK